MNYLDYFAKGGKTKNTNIIKGIQNILGVDEDQMSELWQIGLNKYGSEEGIAQALDEATKGLTEQSQPEDVKNAILSVFTMDSEMFKCGGKLQKLAQRFAKGGNIGCGCSGIKVGAEGFRLPKRPRLRKAPDAGRATERRVGLGYDENNMPYVYEDASIGGNSTNTAASIVQPGDTIVRQRIATREGWAPRTYLPGSEEYEMVMSRLRPYFPTEPVSLQDGGTPDVQIRRRQAKQLSNDIKGTDNREFRSAMRMARRMVREDPELYANRNSRKDRRMAARAIAAGLMETRPTIDTTPVVPEIITEPISGPTKYTEAITETGPVQVVSITGTKPKVVTKPNAPIGSAPSIADSLAAKKAKQDAWYQYQYERSLYDQANGNYRPNQDSAAYQHWMWKDFNDAWDDRTNTVKRDYLMGSPTQRDLLAFRDAGEFTHGSLPWSRNDRESYGVDYNKRQFYFDDDSRYRADMQAKGIPATSNLYNGLANTLGGVIMTGVGAGISGTGAAWDAIGGNVRVANPTGIEMRLPKLRGRSINPTPKPTSKLDVVTPKRTSTRLFPSNQGYAKWVRRLTGKTIPESARSGYFME